MTDSIRDAQASIRELTHKYSMHVDNTHDFDALSLLFTEDGIFDASEVGLPAFEGREGVRSGFVEMDKQISASCHIVGNHLIEVTGDTASGTCWYYGRGMMLGGEHRDSCGYYDDKYVHTADGWRFGSRILHLLVPVDYEMQL